MWKKNQAISCDAAGSPKHSFLIYAHVWDCHFFLITFPTCVCVCVCTPLVFMRQLNGFFIKLLANRQPHKTDLCTCTCHLKSGNEFFNISYGMRYNGILHLHFVLQQKRFCYNTYIWDLYINSHFSSIITVVWYFLKHWLMHIQ